MQNILDLPSKINTFGIFLLIGFLLFAYVSWQEGKNDGFDDERIFDLLLTSFISAIFLSRFVFALIHVEKLSAFIEHIFKVWTPGYDIFGALAGFLLQPLLFSKKWKWSIYRILDIFALGASLSLAIIVLAFVAMQSRFEFLFAFAAFILSFVIFSKLRSLKLKSGYVFCLFLLVCSATGLIFFNQANLLSFYLLLVTLSLVVFLFRWRLANYDNAFITRLVGSIKGRFRK